MVDPRADLMICLPFPEPSPALQEVLSAHTVIRSGDQDAIADLGDITDLPRPWLPATCTDELRAALWKWCDDVVSWLNREYAWRPTSMVPACWPRHPHIAGEVAVLACLRHSAGQGHSPDQMEEWHRYTLPMFLDRVSSRLGRSTCDSGTHQDWPAAARYDAHLQGESTREALFATDTHPPTPLRSARQG